MRDVANMPLNESKLAREAKIASIKEKLAKALKLDIAEKINKSFKDKLEEIEKPVHAERNKLAKACTQSTIEFVDQIDQDFVQMVYDNDYHYF